jgi:hypothetical protein
MAKTNHAETVAENYSKFLVERNTDKAYPTRRYVSSCSENIWLASWNLSDWDCISSGDLEMGDACHTVAKYLETNDLRALCGLKFPAI